MNFKKILFLLLIYTINFLHSQDLKSNYVCTYKLDYSINGKKDTEQFILFIDAINKKSFFQSSINYAKDTVDIKDPLQLAGYESDFNEKVLFDKNSFKVFETVIDAKLSYSENQKIKWVILDKIKKEENITMQLAKTSAYGRTWYAWFSKDVPIDFGPYKFNGLPGFIVSLYDEKKNFVFTLQKFKKKIKKLKLPNSKSFKSIPKSTFNKSRFKIQTADNGVVIFNNAKERESWMKKLEERYTSFPLLDIEYPIN
ncbi:GLPGLI family protein [Chryseobacterium ureilyticum]|uniref:GLPGLI family protein n=1 Tax=Chryseobacterium ureilyticum TaxID=373668 RepID=A0A1N7M2D8_9FLAO|nr:GLPGLI family protein [Chryseobacterium ureilyticum]SIS80212.1 GLPGLI family protein [Chryseobacterium ureilyticum]